MKGWFKADCESAQVSVQPLTVMKLPASSFGQGQYSALQANPFAYQESRKSYRACL